MNKRWFNTSRTVLNGPIKAELKKKKKENDPCSLLLFGILKRFPFYMSIYFKDFFRHTFIFHFNLHQKKVYPDTNICWMLVKL